MKTIVRTVLIAALFALTAGIATSTAARAEETPAKSTGTIIGRVLDDKGQPAKGVRVGAFTPGAFANANRTGAKTQPAAPADKTRREPLAKTITDDDGSYRLTDVPAGKVRILAGAKGSGFGFAHELVEVKPAETTKAPDIKLRTAADRPARPNNTKPA